MKLPKTFRVGRKKYQVHNVHSIRRGYRGLVTHSKGEVLIAKRGPHVQYTPSEQHETLLHEMVHAVLFDMDSKYNTEAFVEPFARKLSKAIMSARF
jgi:hypothetical protein